MGRSVILHEKLKLPTNRGRLFYKYGVCSEGMKALEVNKFRALGMIDEVKGL
jgi:hypothetical protein